MYIHRPVHMGVYIYIKTCKCRCVCVCVQIEREVTETDFRDWLRRLTGALTSQRVGGRVEVQGKADVVALTLKPAGEKLRFIKQCHSNKFNNFFQKIEKLHHRNKLFVSRI